jgi:hypothetical protein
LIRRLLLRFRQIDRHSRALLVEALACLLAARLALIFIPFPRLGAAPRHFRTTYQPARRSNPS